MREFIDRARGYEKQGLFTPLELGDIQAALRFYDCLRRGGFSITEEDIDNVENLLSLIEAGLHWIPTSPNLPVHGHKLGSAE